MMRIVGWSLGAVVLVWYLFWLAVPINLVTADIGRHVTNGRLLLEEWSANRAVLATNFYSYTEPQFPVINHHWASGILFSLLYTAGGWKTVHVFFIGLGALAMLLMYDMARRRAGWLAAAVVSLVLVPLIAARVEVRPEAFSYFFLAFFGWILWRVRAGEISPRWTWLLPFLQVLWVNSHIYFIFGIFAVGVFWGEAVLRRLLPHPLFDLLDRQAGKAQSDLSLCKEGGWGEVKSLGFILLAVILASFVNPFGWWGVVYPFTIFSNYGYQIVENQSIWFLENWGQHNPHFLMVKLLSGVLALGAAYQLWRRRSFDLALTILGITIMVLAWLAIRNFTMAGLIMLPLVAHYITLIPWRKLMAETELYQKRVMIVLSVVVVGAVTYFYYFDSVQLQRQRIGIGLMPQVNAAADFIRVHHISGPIFNNYDNGGYLIYHLYPEEKVFVDNRPEAYSTAFFEKVYKPMQENDDVWREQLAKYDFNSIIFYRHDLTPWAQQFLISRVQDPEWVPIYFDAFSIIFVREGAENAALIKEYGIPRQAFGVQAP